MYIQDRKLYVMRPLVQASTKKMTEFVILPISFFVSEGEVSARQALQSKHFDPVRKQNDHTGGYVCVYIYV